MSSEVRVKKISAYPIAAQLILKSGTSAAKIMKVTDVGFLAEVDVALLQVHDKVEVKFEFPVTHQHVHEHGIVIKLHNQFAGTSSTSTSTSASSPAAAQASADAKGTPPPAKATPATKFGDVKHLVEIHFKPLSDKGRKAIVDFLRQLGRPPGTPS